MRLVKTFVLFGLAACSLADLCDDPKKGKKWLAEQEKIPLIPAGVQIEDAAAEQFKKQVKNIMDTYSEMYTLTGHSVNRCRRTSWEDVLGDDEVKDAKRINLEIALLNVKDHLQSPQAHNQKFLETLSKLYVEEQALLGAYAQILDQKPMYYGFVVAWKDQLYQFAKILKAQEEV